MAKVSEAIREPIQEILGAIKWVLGRIPPELCADILQNGIFLTVDRLHFRIWIR